MHAYRETKELIFCRLGQWFRSESGVTSVEYALIGLLIAVVILGAVTAVGLEVGSTYDYIASCVANLECP